ncbi:MAG TPA: extracellular solute-binding protein [Actinocrinis sp.]|uniref:extracellular solute-binding protein n=1 Tax=Actinocrinis sp. TaxID=1920516 RepID=UPI002DDCA61D|nr:extracellular solute-binding protein [Actinocrinis sp.]HEV2343809.1 extracellular solute-binding protein [Actinocrinis sp.]
MKRTIAVAAALTAAALTASACSSSSSGGNTSTPQSVLSTSGAGKTVTVWLMVDAQKGWPDVVAAAKTAFEKETGAKLNIEYQQWSNYTTKLDTALLSGNAPDALELGNTQTAKYINAGSFVDLTSVKGQFDNSAQWLDSLAASGQSADGTKTFAVPYYAGARVLIYRKDLFAAAGVATPPATLDDLTADLTKVQAKNASTPNFSALYLPGKDWYTALSFGAGTYGVKGVIAKASGSNYSGTLTDPTFVNGIQTWYGLQKKFSVGGATVDESNQDALMAKGNIAAIIGAGWEAGSVVDPKAGNPALANDLAEIPVPGTAAGTPTPAFLGGSDLAVPTHAANAALGAEFLRIFTDTATQTLLAKYAIPNNKTLISAYEAASSANQATGEAAKASTWFIPNSPNWSGADETALQTAFSAVATGTDPASALGTAQTTILGDLNAQ